MKYPATGKAITNAHNTSFIKSFANCKWDEYGANQRQRWDCKSGDPMYLKSTFLVIKTTGLIGINVTRFYYSITVSVFLIRSSIPGRSTFAGTNCPFINVFTADKSITIYAIPSACIVIVLFGVASEFQK